MSDEQASVREWTDILVRIRFGTVKYAGRNVTGARIKAVAGRLADYADSNGSRVRPGLSRLAVDLEMDYRTVKASVAILRGLGLLKLVRSGRKAGHADEYRLAIPVDLLEHVEVWSPAKQTLEVDRVRDANRGKYRKDDLQGQEATADGTVCRATVDPQADDLQGHAGPAGAPPPPEPAGACWPRNDPPAVACSADLQGHPGPATDQVPIHNYDRPTDEDARTAVTGPGVTEAVEDPSLADDVNAGGRPPLRLIEDIPPPTDWRGLPGYGQLDRAQAARNSVGRAQALARINGTKPAIEEAS